MGSLASETSVGGHGRILFLLARSFDPVKIPNAVVNPLALRNDLLFIVGRLRSIPFVLFNVIGPLAFLFGGR
jgi:hypothetical protein